MTWKGFPNPARVRIALAEKGAADAVEFVPIDVFGGVHRTKAFRFKKPDASVPCLELADGSFISQSTAIIEYIDGSFEGESLTGKSPKERAQISMVNLRAESGLMNAVGAYFHHATLGLGRELEKDQCVDWANMQKQMASRTMVYLDEVLAANDFVAGDRFSIADITAFAGLVFANFAKVEIPVSLKT